jgi:hypothetical protein
MDIENITETFVKSMNNDAIRAMRRTVELIRTGQNVDDTYSTKIERLIEEAIETERENTVDTIFSNSCDTLRTLFTKANDSFTIEPEALDEALNDMVTDLTEGVEEMIMLTPQIDGDAFYIDVNVECDEESFLEEMIEYVFRWLYENDGMTINQTRDLYDLVSTRYV